MNMLQLVKFDFDIFTKMYRTRLLALIFKKRILLSPVDNVIVLNTRDLTLFRRGKKENKQVWRY